MINYRGFQSHDADQVFEVAKNSWEETYKEIFSTEFISKFVNKAYDPNSLQKTIPLIEAGLTGFWVATNNNSVVGFAQVGYSSTRLEKKDPKNEIYLYRIYVDPDHLGKGVGSELLELVENWVKKEQKGYYVCYCHKNNDLGKQFYFKKKFEHIPERDNLEENEIFLLKKLF
ncbi:MAG: GNAT family N-acetyltransferase [Candidatus Heimdallarchaeota archaeon]|nr:GNAT family N-acetyltransferase [Candidatus Heimdallarchaeota archaeon]